MIAAEAAEGHAIVQHAIEDPSAFLDLAWLIALLPFASAALTLFLGKRTPGKGTIYGIAAIGTTLVLSLGVLWTFVQGEQGFHQATIEWFTIGPLHMELGVYIDGLTAVMLVVVTSISLCVHVYSLGYMKGDVRYTWFYVVLSMFTGAMLVVVLASNLFQLLLGWEIMGVCSYLLIGHWWEEKTNSNAAIKAFITTRVGDVPFMFGIFALIFATGFETSNIAEIGEIVHSGGASNGLVAAAALLLFGGTIGKSAQFPLQVWLPDAMAGPTPVSALIHAATMVAAGVYLVGRMFQVFVAADPYVLQVVGIVAGITMFGAALLALVQDDIKRVLAFSTISQLAYMVAGMSMGGVGRTAGFFHLFTHAFFKALLFLGAGSVIHAVHSNNMSEMGGLRKPLPWTFWTFLIGSIALAGIPPLAGFWSKDELLVVASDEGHPVLFVVLLATALLTAFYMTRCVLLTFFGDYRGHGHPHESPASMTGVLVFLALATIGVGFLGAPQLGAVFGQWVFFEEIHAAVFHVDIAALSVGAAVAGVVLGGFAYRNVRERERDPMLRMGPVTTLLENRYYMDAFYLRGIVFPIRDKVSAAVYWTNQHVLDGAVNGAAALSRGMARGVMWVDRNVIDGAVNASAALAGFTGGLLRYLQSGNVQRYAAFLFTGVVVLAIIFTRT
ncbi:MAG TPA: NADH-quinone oxidoreductase subunit L [Actinomycetota bacterium]|nr:NADH-quinone oxidoreductase subunit L [Actinomycetota bacterium]